MNLHRIMIGAGLFIIGLLITLVVRLRQKTNQEKKTVVIVGTLLSAVASLIMTMAGNYF